MNIEDKTISKIFYSVTSSLFFLAFLFQFPAFISGIEVTNPFAVSNILIYQGIYFLIVPTLFFILILIWKPIKQRFIELLSITYLSVFVFIISFPIAYHVLNLGRELSKIQNVQIGTSDGWLSFIGSIFGGLITLIALIFTLNHQNRTREEIERASLFPVIALSTHDQNENLPIILDTPIKLVLKVIGENHIKNLSLKFANLSLKSKIESLKTSKTNEYINVNLEEKDINEFLKQNFKTNFLPGDSELEIKILFPIKPIFDEFIHSYQEYSYKCIFDYQNILENKNYRYLANIQTNIYVYFIDKKFTKTSISRIIDHNIIEIRDNNFKKN